MTAVTPRLITLVGVALVLVALLGLALAVAVGDALGDSAPQTTYTYGVDGYVWAHGNGTPGAYLGGATVSLQAPCGGCFSTVASATSGVSGFYSITYTVTNPTVGNCSYRLEASAPGYAPGYNASFVGPIIVGQKPTPGCLDPGGTVVGDFYGLSALSPLNGTAGGGGVLGGTVSTSELEGLVVLGILLIGGYVLLRYRSQEDEADAAAAKAQAKATRKSRL